MGMSEVQTHISSDIRSSDFRQLLYSDCLKSEPLVGETECFCVWLYIEGSDFGHSGRRFVRFEIFALS